MVIDVLVACGANTVVRRLSGVLGAAIRSLFSTFVKSFSL